MSFELKLLYTGANLQEATAACQADINTINANVTAWKGRPILIDAEPFILTALPEINGETAYCCCCKPLPAWPENIIDGVDGYYTEAMYSYDWVLPEEPPPE
jgi:hypothetical protein